MPLQKPSILIVDQENPEIRNLIDFLQENNYEVLWARDGEAAFNVIDSHTINALITELKVQRIDGMRLHQIAKKRNQEICTIMVTDKAEIELATEAMRQGAYDFQTKPLNFKKLLLVLSRAISHQRLVTKVDSLEKRLDVRYGLENITGHSMQIIAVANKIKQIAPARCTVLLCGETGTGKELVAQAIHHGSLRKDGPFVKLNCAALAESVIESELFGHEKGAFTGATSKRKGRFEIADGGTLFLDEIGEVTPRIQTKLLRVIEERTFERLGSNDTQRTDVRLLAATNKNLRDLVKSGIFREDLYYRLSVVTIDLPPLRERKEDIPLLIESFVKQFNKENSKKVTGITRGAMDLLFQYNWPGNVRELRNCIEGMVVFTNRRRDLDVSDLPEQFRSHEPELGNLHIRVGMSMGEIEAAVISNTLKAVGYDKKRAAEILNIGLRTLYRKVKKYEIT